MLEHGQHVVWPASSAMGIPVSVERPATTDCKLHNYTTTGLRTCTIRDRDFLRLIGFCHYAQTIRTGPKSALWKPGSQLTGVDNNNRDAA